MSVECLTFEQPLNERIRSFLRLEHLFQQIDYNINASSQWSSRECLSAIIEILNLLDRSDIKAEIIKELERQTKSVTKMSKTLGIDPRSLDSVLDDLNEALESLRDKTHNLTKPFKENEFLATIRQRLTIPGGSCNFDLPVLHSWLALPFKERQEYLTNCVAPLFPLKQALALILYLTRKSSTPIQAKAEAGHFAKDLSGQHPYQLVRIVVKSDLKLYPKVSGSKHRVNIQFMVADYNGNPSAVSQDAVDFELTCCAI